MMAPWRWLFPCKSTPCHVQTCVSYSFPLSVSCAGPHADRASGCQNLQCGFRVCCRSGEWSPFPQWLPVLFGGFSPHLDFSLSLSFWSSHISSLSPITLSSPAFFLFLTFSHLSSLLRPLGVSPVLSHPLRLHFKCRTGSGGTVTHKTFHSTHKGGEVKVTCSRSLCWAIGQFQACTSVEECVLEVIGFSEFFHSRRVKSFGKRWMWSLICRASRKHRFMPRIPCEVLFLFVCFRRNYISQSPMVVYRI